MNHASAQRARRPLRPVTSAFLERAALAYLERFSTSVENLRRVLQRKVETRCRLRGEDPAAALDLVDAVVARAVAGGLVDDRRYAEGRVATLRRRGGSARLIRARLGGKGVDRATAEAALGGDPEAELAAATAFARRRKLGPFRPGERALYRDRDLASLARAGFGFSVARQVVEGEADTDL